MKIVNLSKIKTEVNWTAGDFFLFEGALRQIVSYSGKYFAIDSKTGTVSSMVSHISANDLIKGSYGKDAVKVKINTVELEEI